MSKRSITPHKGGRTERQSIRVTPEVKAMIKWLRENHRISVADIFEDAIFEKYNELAP